LASRLISSRVVPCRVSPFGGVSWTIRKTPLSLVPFISLASQVSPTDPRLNTCRRTLPTIFRLSKQGLEFTVQCRMFVFLARCTPYLHFPLLLFGVRLFKCRLDQDARAELATSSNPTFQVSGVEVFKERPFDPPFPLRVAGNLSLERAPPILG